MRARRPRRRSPLPGAITTTALVITLAGGHAVAAFGEPFSSAAARAHVERLAGTIGSRAIGTAANAEARTYLIAQLRDAGFDVRLQTADAARPELGLTARVVNIIATRGNMGRGAVALVSHYDSAPNAPGAADAALGVAVTIEAARALSDPPLDHGLMVVLTDGEEVGLMGAAAFVDDPAMAAIQAYLNFEAIGARGPSLLFEAGPGNGWVLDAWASAPRPRGSSLALEVYARLPNDTDFSILKRSGVPGLNFAAIHDSYAYHSPLDTPDRLADSTLAHAGRNAVAIVRALDRVDLTMRSDATSVYFDVLGLHGVAYDIATQWWLSLAAIVFGIAAAVRAIVTAWRAAGARRLILSVLWAVITTIVAIASALAPPVAMRLASPWNSPWYAHPERLFVLITAACLAGIWLCVRVIGRLPRRAQGTWAPHTVWAISLPLWVSAAVLAQRAAPTAAYLITTPLLAAGLALCVAPSLQRHAGHASVFVFTCAAVLWGSPLIDLSTFVTPVLGRMPVVTPAFIHPALVIATAMVVVPPGLGSLSAISGRRTARRARLVDVAVIGTLVAACVWVAVGPAYSEPRPMRRTARFVEDLDTGAAFWEVGGIEPLLDLDRRAGDLDWQPAGALDATPRGVAPLRLPYVLRAPARAWDDPLVLLTGHLESDSDRVMLHIDAVPLRPGLRLDVHLPPDAIPIEASIPGVVRDRGEWVATYIAPPMEGIRISATIRSDQADAIRQGAVTVRAAGLPGGLGWQQLPPWLPAARVAWDAFRLSRRSLATVLGTVPVDSHGGSLDAR